MNIRLKKNIELALDLQCVSNKDEKIDNALKYVNMIEHKNKKISELSGGQKQRVAIARSLVKDSEIIIADEPTGNLDSKTSESILEIFKKLSKEKLVIIVTHNMSECVNYADIVLEVKNQSLTELKYNKNVDCEDIILLKEKLDTNLINRINDLILEDENVYIVKSVNNISEMKRITLSNTLLRANDLKYSQKKKKESIKSKFPISQSMLLAKDYIMARKIKSTFAVILFSISIMLFGMGLVISATNYDAKIYNALEAKPDLMFEVGIPREIQTHVSDYIGYEHYSRLVTTYPDVEFGIKFTDGMLRGGRFSSSLVFSGEVDQYFNSANVVEYSVNVQNYDFLPYELVAGDISSSNRGTYVIPDFLAEWIVESGSYSYNLDSYDDILFKSLDQIFTVGSNSSAYELERYMIVGIYHTGIIPTLESIHDDELAYNTVTSLANYYSFSINADSYMNSTTEFMPVVLSGTIDDKYELANDYYTYDSSDLTMIENAREIFTEAAILVIVLSIIFTILSVLMMFQYISSSIGEKRKSIGVLRALGGRKGDITLIFILQSFIIIFVSLIVAAIFLVSILGLLNNTFKEVFISNISIFTVTFISAGFILFFTVMTGIISVVLPLKRIYNLTPVEAMS